MWEPPGGSRVCRGQLFRGVVVNSSSEAQLVYEARVLKILFPDIPRATNG